MTPENAAAVLQRKTANVCLRALTDAGVFKMTAEGMQASQRFKKVLENGS
ncbi:galactose-1-phosphate uridylyltransferase [Bacillus amyloliquefaciens]|nr:MULTISPECIES: galactose-1-phosphate uridylyltransferase [Bacillus amyloliquefaciens group]ASF30850.1 galactose-1-phosphate uridylyltransferase [Bacillus amyloliquefaciens]